MESIAAVVACCTTFERVRGPSLVGEVHTLPGVFLCHQLRLGCRGCSSQVAVEGLVIIAVDRCSRVIVVEQGW